MWQARSGTARPGKFWHDVAGKVRQGGAWIGEARRD
jgi:hypothetical protein